MRHEDLASHYTGEVAGKYEERRISEPRWAKEQSIVYSILRDLKPGSTLLDVPVGTGRFIDFYKDLKLEVTGADVSKDMLAIAGQKAEAAGLEMAFETADICRLPFASSSFDAALCMRLLNWLDREHLDAAISELSRVARHTVIISIRCWSHPEDRTILDRFAVRAAKLYRHLQGAQIVIHEIDRMDAVSRRQGLSTIRSELVDCIEKWSVKTPYYILVLSKTL